MAVLIVCSAGDAPMKALRQREKWERVIHSVPHLEHWTDRDALQDPTPMAGVLDRYRRFVIDGQPVMTGMVTVGDAWACTNPQAGRGITVGLLQAIALRDVLRKFDDPHEIAMEFDRRTEEECTPWYQMQVARDRAKHAAVQQSIAGREVAPIPDPLSVAAAYDPDVARAQLEVLTCLSLPNEVMARPDVREKILASSDRRDLPPVSGPTRAELLALIA